MSAAALGTIRFVRRTSLRTDEYRKNFQQIDDDVVAALTSSEADAVTPLMSKIYLRLLRAPACYWERPGVLRIVAEEREGKHVTAWTSLCDIVGVASATASKALLWLHEQGIIGYHAGKNGVGVRIFLNRAASSIGVRRPPAAKKILAFAPASTVEARTSPGEAAFNDSYADPEILDTDLDPHAPKSGAVITPGEVLGLETSPNLGGQHSATTATAGQGTQSASCPPFSRMQAEEMLQTLKVELEQSLQNAARRAAHLESELTREWLDKHGLPKASRVAQREAFNILRSHGLVRPTKSEPRCKSHGERQHVTTTQPPRPLSALEISELAETCVAMLELRGQTFEDTLATLTVASGGQVLPDDLARVRELVTSLSSRASSGQVTS
ncbi:MAG: hypothetical protein ABR563_14455 [Pyrinomonadaceae bacterium]